MADAKRSFDARDRVQIGGALYRCGAGPEWRDRPLFEASVAAHPVLLNKIHASGLSKAGGRRLGGRRCIDHVRPGGDPSAPFPRPQTGHPENSHA